MKRITEYDNITTVSESDVLPIVDVSDTEQASTGSTRKGTIEKIADYLKDRAETLTNKILTAARLNTPKINEDVEVTATSTELNKLDGLVGGAVGTTDTQTLTNKTLTNPDVTFSDNAPDMGVGCKVHLDGDQTIPTSSMTVVALAIKDWDLGGDFTNTAGNYKFTAPVAGYYFVSMGGLWLDTDPAGASLRIYKNGTGLVAITEGVSYSSVLYLAENDYIQMKVFQTSGDDATLSGDGQRDTSFSVLLLST